MEKISIMRKQIKLLDEFLHYMEYSRTAKKHGIDNSIPDVYSKNVLDLFFVWISLKNTFPELIITSGYRCHKLNKLVNGQPKSKHTICKAIDVASMLGNKRTKEMFIQVYEYLRNNFKSVGYIYSDTQGSFIHFQLN